MRALSYNIHGCVGTDRKERPDRVIKLIKEINADIVGLQEVQSSDDKDRNFLEALKELPYASILYGKTMRKPEADYGNLLLLKNPAISINRLELTGATGEPRGAIIADIKLGNIQMRVINTHLGLRASQRARQTEHILEALASSRHCILMGDLNEWFPAQKYFRRFRNQFTHFSTHRTFPTRLPLFKLDRIGLLGEFKNTKFRILNSSLAGCASDHRPLICEFDF